MPDIAAEARPTAMPEGLDCYRKIGPFNADSLPAGLRAMHRIKEGTWGLLELHSGSITFVWDDDAGEQQVLSGPAMQIVPPQVPHHVAANGQFELTIGFYRLPG